MLQDEGILSETILNKLSFDALENKEQIADNVLLLDVIEPSLCLRSCTDIHPDLVFRLALSTAEPIKFDLFQIFDLFLLR